MSVEYRAPTPDQTTANKYPVIEVQANRDKNPSWLKRTVKKTVAGAVLLTSFAGLLHADNLQDNREASSRANAISASSVILDDLHKGTDLIVFDQNKPVVIKKGVSITPQDVVAEEKKPSSIKVVIKKEAKPSTNKDQERKSVERPSDSSGTDEWIRYFDAHWKQEGLPHDWDNLKSQRSNKRVGFIMNQQMDKLKDPTDKEEMVSWTQQTKRDLEGFKLEFLSDSVVYPRKYHIDPDDSTRLVDPLYGKTPDGRSVDIEESVSEQERNGSVKQSIGEIKDFLLSAPDGSLAVMTSPLGKTGFKTDDGLGIDYPDSYFFIMQKKGNEVMNITIKTSFTLAECRDAIYRLTGKRLTAGASLEEYVTTIAKIRPGEHPKVQNASDVVNELQEVRPKNAFVDTQSSQVVDWDEVHSSIEQGEELYNFDKITTNAIAEFEKYAQAGGHTKKDLRKAIAATILRMAKQFFKKRQRAGSKEVTLEPNRWSVPEQREDYQSFGSLLEKAAERRGCSGVGTAVKTLGGSRLGIVGEDQHGSLAFNCPVCGATNIREPGEFVDACQNQQCKSTRVAC